MPQFRTPQMNDGWHYRPAPRVHRAPPFYLLTVFSNALLCLAIGAMLASCIVLTAAGDAPGGAIKFVVVR